MIYVFYGEQVYGTYDSTAEVLREVPIEVIRDCYLFNDVSLVWSVSNGDVDEEFIPPILRTMLLLLR